MMNFIYERWHHLLTSFNQLWLSPANLKRYADYIHQSGAPLENCWGLVDKTVCRTGKRQWQLYNGHKQVHDIQFQMIVCPYGMMANLYRPIEGHQHYSFMLAKCMPDQKFYIN